MIRKYFLVVVLVVLAFSILPCLAKDYDIRKSVSKYVDLSSMGQDYKVHLAETDRKTFYQIVFINTKNRQRMSFTVHKKRKKVSTEKNKQKIDVIKKKLKKKTTGEYGAEENKNIISGSFKIGKQDVPYVLMDQYFNGRYNNKAMIGLIPDYNGYNITIQSFATGKKYNQALSEQYFRKVKIKTVNMFK